MNRVLLADASPHAQRMGEQILRQEGFEVKTVADGHEASACLASFDPLVVLADVQLPGKSGYDLSREAKSIADGIAVILTLGARAGTPDQAAIGDSCCDATLSKPFEATALVDTVKRLVSEVKALRASRRPKAPAAEMDRERIEAAVTLALEASLPALIQEITERVLIALRK